MPPAAVLATVQAVLAVQDGQQALEHALVELTISDGRVSVLPHLPD